MKYKVKIIPVDPTTSKPPKYTVQVMEEQREGVPVPSDLDDKLLQKINIALSNAEIEFEDELFDKVDESILFNSASPTCPHCGGEK